MLRWLKILGSAGLLALAAWPVSARSDWLFGLFGKEDPVLVPTAETLPYSVSFEGLNSDLTTLLKDNSDTWKLRQEPTPDGTSLTRRVAADLPRLMNALWAEGYYNAKIGAEVAGQAITLPDIGAQKAAGMADRARGRNLVVVRFVAEPGPQFTVRRLDIADARTGASLSPADLGLPRLLLAPGAPARSGAVNALQAQIVDALRDKSFPLTKVTRVAPTVVHPDLVVDLAISVDPGPKAAIGPITLSGTQTIDPAVVRSFIYLEEGDPYSPARLAALRKSLGNVELVGSVRILEADHLDTSGRLPLEVVVGERMRHLISASAQYSTVDGPSIRAAWTDRNLFGGGERLRLEAILGGSADSGGKTGSLSVLDPERLIGRAGVSFIKPALWGSRNDLLSDTYISREVTKTYAANVFNTTTQIRHRFSDEFYVQGGLEAEIGRSTDRFGSNSYTLIGVPVSVHYDSTDKPLDPSRGWRVIAGAAVYPEALGSSFNLVQAKVQASTYFALDGEANTILAARVALGSLSGASTFAIPDNRRFFAGGGGSVRGYAYRSLSPIDAAGVAIGGRSLLEASLEARIKVTDTIGIVPFIDAGSAFSSSYPDFSNKLRFAAGVGLRYYTSFGPLRLDVATPLSRRKGEAPIAVYVSVGQAF